MKPFKITSCLLICSFFIPGMFLSAQVLMQEGDQWNSISYDWLSGSSTTIIRKLGQDTLVNNLTYNQVLVTYDDDPSAAWENYGALIRQDSFGKVFFRENGYETLIYDFSLEIGDTFHFGFECDLIVEDIQMVGLNNGEERKKIILQDQFGAGSDGGYWIDGIGSNFGLRSDLYCWVDYSEELLCYYSNDEQQYPRNPETCFIVGLGELSQTEYRIYPNPPRDLLFIESNNYTFRSFDIYDLSGQLIKKGIIDQTNTQVDIAEFENGFYFIQLEGKDGGFVSKKFIKQ